MNNKNKNIIAPIFNTSDFHKNGTSHNYNSRYIRIQSINFMKIFRKVLDITHLYIISDPCANLCHLFQQHLSLTCSLGVVPIMISFSSLGYDKLFVNPLYISLSQTGP